jgi:hypothetical protein
VADLHTSFAELVRSFKYSNWFYRYSLKIRLYLGQRKSTLLFINNVTAHTIIQRSKRRTFCSLNWKRKTQVTRNMLRQRARPLNMRMGWTCSSDGRNQNSYRIVIVKFVLKWPIGTAKLRWKKNNHIDWLLIDGCRRINACGYMRISTHLGIQLKTQSELDLDYPKHGCCTYSCHNSVSGTRSWKQYSLIEGKFDI